LRASSGGGLIVEVTSWGHIPCAGPNPPHLASSPPPVLVWRMGCPANVLLTCPANVLLNIYDGQATRCYLSYRPGHSMRQTRPFTARSISNQSAAEARPSSFNKSASLLVPAYHTQIFMHPLQPLPVWPCPVRHTAQAPEATLHSLNPPSPAPGAAASRYRCRDGSLLACAHGS
jgi:hypothetical protein